jgi:hypothetical protein
MRIQSSVNRKEKKSISVDPFEFKNVKSDTGSNLNKCNIIRKQRSKMYEEIQTSKQIPKKDTNTTCRNKVHATKLDGGVYHDNLRGIARAVVKRLYRFLPSK